MGAKSGDRVKVQYSLKDINDKVVESTRDSEPLEFTRGDSQCSAISRKVRAMSGLVICVPGRSGSPSASQ